MNNQVFDVIILGGGPSGLTAAIYTSRAFLSTLVLAGNPPGGQLMWTSEVENFPGFPNGIKGPELISDMREQCIKFGSQVKDENALSISGSYKDLFTVVSEEGSVYTSKTIIVATGASAKWLNLPNEQRLRSKGVSACATCDGFFFKEKTVAVVGGGDAALEEATFLTKFCNKIYLLIRGSKENLKASKFMQDKAYSNQKIEFIFNSVVTDVLGEDRVEGIEIQNVLTSDKKVLSDVKGLFVAIGHKPNTDFLKASNLIDLGKQDYAVGTGETPTTTKTEGLFIAGDVSDWRYRQAITASGYGCMAAIDCEKFLSEKKLHEE